MEAFLTFFLCSFSICYGFSRLNFLSSSITSNIAPTTRLQSTRTSTPNPDVYETFSVFDKLLFHRFAQSVATETKSQTPTNYQELIAVINRMTKSQSFPDVNNAGKNMLVRLFPSWLLKQYQWMFAAPFPKFSAWMNAWVTHATTHWLMGNSTVIDMQLSDGSVAIQQGLVIEKCRFLEVSGCMQTCIHACKIPTQRFFLEEMGLPVTLKPNATDYSCTFEFGFYPLPLADDPISQSPCLSICTSQSRRPGQPSCKLDT
jgi:hypothetical protein